MKDSVGNEHKMNSGAQNPVDTGRKLNVHKTFRRRPGRLVNVLCTFNLRPVSAGNTAQILSSWVLYLQHEAASLVQFRRHP